MAKTVAIIGAGQIGFAAAHVFFAAGWDVTIHARSRPNWFQFSENWRPYTAPDDPPPSADVVFDTIAYDAEDIAHFDPDAIGRYITVSSVSVYCDEKARTLDEGLAHGYPRFAGPITEDQTTIAPGPDTYSTRKVRMENAAIKAFGDRATILRPCAIYGPHCRQPREWWFVKRILDGRSEIPLSFDGNSQFQTTDVEMIGHFAAWAAEKDLSGAFNLADSNAPSVLEIGQTIADLLERPGTFRGFEGAPKGTVGRTPWSIPKPFIISSAKAEATGLYPCSERYKPSAALQWLCKQPLNDWEPLFPVLVRYGYDLFDYAAEDRFLASL
ncbi:MAG: reductase [Pseudomonadota bacterium]